jgi:hypothetical protein
MSQATDRLNKAFEQLQVVLAEIAAAQQAIPDEEYTLDLPTVLVSTYEPRQSKGSFVLMGTVHHAAKSFERGLHDPENYPFRDALVEAMGERVANRSMN